MKKLLPLTILTIFNISIAFTQTKVCETKENNLTDINDIGISKCESETTAKKKNKRVISISQKKSKTRFRKVNSIKKTSNQLTSKIGVQLSLSNQSPNIKLPTHKKAILFNLVEEVPLFDGCKKTTREESSQCFKTKLNNHIAKYFHPEEITDELINEKILIQFTIGINGKVSSINVNSKSNNKLIIKELIKTLQKSPEFTPGKQQGFPVNVIYSFPLNLTLI